MKRLFTLVIATLLAGCSLLSSAENKTSNDETTALAALALVSSRSSVGGGTGNANIASTTPTNGQVLTASSSTVVITFTSAMNTSSVQSAMTVSDGSSTITGTYAWSGGNTVLTFTPTALTAYKLHTVTLSSSAQNASGTSIGSASFNFRIGPFFQANGKYWTSGTASLMTGSAAISYCSGLGMTLPTSQSSSDFSVGYTANSSGVFNPGALLDYYWSSTSWAGTDMYICRIAAGPALDCASHTDYVASPAQTYRVRCVL